MFRHVVLIRWKPDVTAEQVATAMTALRSLPAQIPQIRRYLVGSDAGVDAGNADFAIVADFDSADDYRVYRDDPKHTAVIETLLRPMIGARTAVQYEAD